MTITTYNGIGRAISLPDRPLEPTENWYEEPEEEETDDGIDLDDGWILKMGEWWRRMTERENREMEYLRLCGKLQRLSENGIDASREEALQCCEGIMEILKGGRICGLQTE